MLGDREFHDFIEFGKKRFPNMFDECLVCTSCLSSLHEHLVLHLKYLASGLSTRFCSILYNMLSLLGFHFVWRVSQLKSFGVELPFLAF